MEEQQQVQQEVPIETQQSPQQPSTLLQKKIIIYGGIVVLLLLCALGYAYYASSVAYNNVINEATIMQQDITRLQEKRKTQDSTLTWKTYRSEEYGFEMELHDNWKNYKTNILKVEKSVSDVGHVAVGFYLPTDDEKFHLQDMGEYAWMFSILIYTPDAWDRWQAWRGIPGEGFAPSKIMLTQNDKYIFSYYAWFDIPDDLSGQHKDIGDIVQTIQPIDASSWLIYRNKEVGYEISYPLDMTHRPFEKYSKSYVFDPFNVYIDSNNVPAIEGSGGNVNIKPVNGDAYHLYSQARDGCEKYAINQPALLSSGQTTVGREIAWQYACTGEYGGDYRVIYLQQNAGEVLKISLGYDSPISLIHDQILSTFRFIE